MSLFLCKMSSFVCLFICSISSCSPPLFFLIVDTSSLLMISLIPLWLSHVYTEKKQNLYVLSFSFCLLVCRWSCSVLYCYLILIQHPILNSMHAFFKKNLGCFQTSGNQRSLTKLWILLMTTRQYNLGFLYLNCHDFEDLLYIQIMVFALHMDTGKIFIDWGLIMSFSIGIKNELQLKFM